MQPDKYKPQNCVLVTPDRRKLPVNDGYGWDCRNPMGEEVIANENRHWINAIKQDMIAKKEIEVKDRGKDSTKKFTKINSVTDTLNESPEYYCLN